MAPKPIEEAPNTIRQSKRGYTTYPVTFTDLAGNQFTGSIEGYLIPFGDSYILLPIQVYRIISISQPAPKIGPNAYIIFKQSEVTLITEEFTTNVKNLR